MSIGAIAPQFYLKFDTTNLDKALDALTTGGAITAFIFNDARSQDGTYYFRYVDGGRGPVRPIRAKALHWIGKDGKDVFAMYAKGVAPRHIIIRAIAVINQERPQFSSAGKPIREAIADYVNAVAVIAVEEFQKLTPVVTGKLRNSYRIQPARG
jgi:hypothetical protein